MHDIGKLGLSNEVLDNDKLDNEELAAMKRHTTFGATILSRIEAFASAASIAEKHYEKLDGTGYLFRIGGAEIHLDTRIVTVADIWDALTADRPYRPAMSSVTALAILQSDAGTALDGKCVDALAISSVA